MESTRSYPYWHVKIRDSYKRRFTGDVKVSSYQQKYKSEDEVVARTPYCLDYDICPADLSESHREETRRSIHKSLTKGSLVYVILEACAVSKFHSVNRRLHDCDQSLLGIRPGQIISEDRSESTSFNTFRRTWHLLLEPGTQLKYTVAYRRRILFGMDSMPGKQQEHIISITDKGVSKDAHLDPTASESSLRLQRIHTAVDNLLITTQWERNLREAMVLAQLPQDMQWTQQLRDTLAQVQTNLSRVDEHVHRISPLDCCQPLIVQTRAILEKALKENGYAFLLGVE